VAASSWFEYSSGVFTGCGTDFDLDHGVQLVGYGTDSGMDYWVRASRVALCSACFWLVDSGANVFLCRVLFVSPCFFN
jgi:hypothetical protein